MLSYIILVHSDTHLERTLVRGRAPIFFRFHLDLLGASGVMNIDKLNIYPVDIVKIMLIGCSAHLRPIR